MEEKQNGGPFLKLPEEGRESRTHTDVPVRSIGSVSYLLVQPVGYLEIYLNSIL